MQQSSNENLKLEQQLLTELPLIDTTSSQPFINTHVVGCSSHREPYDRYRQTAAFISGYCSIPSERVEELARIIRTKAEHDKPYELVHCQKCDTEVEIEFYEGDECSQPHFYCPKCYANYYDRKAKEPWIELDSYYEDLEERLRESQFDYDDDF